MNRNIQACICMAALFLGTGCTKDGEYTPAERQEVEVSVSPLSGHISVTRAKGPMTGWFNTEVYMAYGESSDGSFLGFTSAKKGIVVSAKTSFTPQLFYPESKTIFLKGFYPRESITNLDPDGSIPPDGKIRYTITGQEDIMTSNTVSGSISNTLKEQEESIATLCYDHLLTRLSFILKCENGFPTTLRVVCIRIKNVKVNAVLDLNVLLGPSSDYGATLTFDPAPTADLIAYENASGLTLSTNASAVLGNIMFCGGDVFTVEVELSNGDKIEVSDIRLNSNPSVNIAAGNTQSGHYYPVTLTFKLSDQTPVLQAVWNEEKLIEEEEKGWW